MENDIRRLIFQAIDETISDSDFARLQDLIENDSEFREEYLRAVNLCHSLGEIGNGLSKDTIRPERSDAAETHSAVVKESFSKLKSIQSNDWSWRNWAIAAAALFLASSFAFWLGRYNGSSQVGVVADPPPGLTAIDHRESESAESRIAGHATLRKVVDVDWGSNSRPHREGDLLPNGPFSFEKGITEIDFFCGATLIVEGPAKLSIDDDWTVTVLEGRMRASVPPAARGFVVNASGSKIVDLGTEFALEVSDEKSLVEVIDGEIELRGGEHDGQHLVTGQSRSLKGDRNPTGLAEGLSSPAEIRHRQLKAETDWFDQWKQHSSELGKDQRLIAYYPIASHQSERVVTNRATTGPALDGQLVGPVDQSPGRFGVRSFGLEFDRPGARVRTRIDGQFQALTFSCWARIDSLEHRYNALFMADSYETGEPHWQIRDDGRMMFSVMVDDSQDVRFFNEREQRVVKDAGLHRVYYTPPIWDISQSGRWFHLAATYDPAKRQVKQFVNGKQVSNDTIVDKFHITTLRIGAAEIGNWGQPFRQSPWFSVRNFNGTIDELAIFNAALNQEEIELLYEQGKPIGY